MKILAISGSTREASTNTALLKAIKDHAPQGIDMSVVHNLHLLPVFSPDNEGEYTPRIVDEFLQAVSSHDGLLISSPEYVRAIPGGLKNAIDWMVSRDEVVSKPIVLVHASHRGDDMLRSLRLVLSTVSSNFIEHIFLRFPLVDKPPEAVKEYLGQSAQQLQIRSFLLQFVQAIHQCNTGASIHSPKSKGEG